MATAIASTGFTQEAFDAFLAARDEPAWLVDLRRAAWRRFLELPMPSSRDEEWMRTDIRLFKLDRYHVPDPTPHESPEFPHALLAAGVELGGRTVSVDSRSVLSELSPELRQAGRAVRQPRAGWWPSMAICLRPFFERQVVDPFKDKFSALNAACWSGGPLLYVPKGVRIDEPLHTLSALADGGVDLNKILVILEPGAEATLLSETASTTSDGGGLHCGAIELDRRAGSPLAVRQLAELGERGLALRPSEGPRRPRRHTCNGRSARWAESSPR